LIFFVIYLVVGRKGKRRVLLVRAYLDAVMFGNLGAYLFGCLKNGMAFLTQDFHVRFAVQRL